MAEQASTQPDATAQAHSQTAGPGDSAEETTVVLSAGDSPAQTQPPASQTTETTTEPSLEELRRQNERLHANVQGWQEQSRRNLEERNTLAERIARLEGSLSATQAKETPQAANSRKIALKTALNKWLNGDDSEIDSVEQFLSQTPAQTTNPSLNTQDVESLVNRHLSTLMSTGQALAWVGERHPEMRSRTDPIYADIFENYEAYSQDPGYAMLFPQDPRFSASIPSPDGLRTKNMDVRVVNDLAARLKLSRSSSQTLQQGREQESRASSVGQVAGSNGSTSRTPSERTIEAWDLLSEKDHAEIRNMIMSRAVPSGWPKTERGIAKKLYDLATPAERDTMQSSFRRQSRGVN